MLNENETRKAAAITLSHAPTTISTTRSERLGFIPSLASPETSQSALPALPSARLTVRLASRAGSDLTSHIMVTTLRPSRSQGSGVSECTDSIVSGLAARTWLMGGGAGGA